MVKLTDLLERLPVTKRMTLLTSAHPAISQPAAPDNFVAPPLRMPQGSRADFSRPIILVSAPGAVGKTTIATEVASRYATALWDLSRIALGDNTFIGTLAASFGAGQLGPILSALQKGEALFVFDAFDEAEVLSGWDRVETFVRELWSHVSHADFPAVIMLARTETASLLDLLLTDLASSDPRHALVTIDFFDEAGAKRFVDEQLKRVHGVDAHEQHREPFGRALSAVFDVLARRLGSGTRGEPWDLPTCRSFLGYAPVLQAIAAYLADYNNYQEALTRIESATASESRDDILPSLIAGLLEREQGKFVTPLREQVRGEPDEYSDWNALYTEQEQLRRVFLYIADIDESVSALDSLPTWLQTPYADALRHFLPNHPFLRGREFAGPAFQDYVYATLLTDDEIGPIVETWLEERIYVPTPLFAEFYRIACNGLGYGTHAGLIYESTAGRFDMDRASGSAYVRPESDGGIHSLSIVPDDEANRHESYEIQLVVNDARPLTFTHRLRSAVLNVSGRLVLASPSQFEVGDVEIEAQALEIQTPLLSVRGYPNRQQSLIQSEASVTYPHQFRLEVRPEAELKVNWPESGRYPWAGYADTELFSERRDRKGAMLALRRILIWFRKDRRVDLARYRELIDNVIIGHSTVRQQMRHFLIEKGILRVEGKFYMMSPDDAQLYGINWTSLRDSVPSTALMPVLDEFLRFSGAND